MSVNGNLMVPKIPKDGFTFQGEPVIPSKPLSLISRNSFINGDIPVVCGPGQYDHIEINDWSKSGTLLRIPKMIRICGSSNDGVAEYYLFDIRNQLYSSLKEEFKNYLGVFVDNQPEGYRLAIDNPVNQAKSFTIGDNAFCPNIFGIFFIGITKTSGGYAEDVFIRLRSQNNALPGGWTEWTPIDETIQTVVITRTVTVEGIEEWQYGNVTYYPSDIAPLVTTTDQVSRINWIYSLAPSMRVLCFFVNPPPDPGDEYGTNNNLNDWQSLVNSFSDYGYLSFQEISSFEDIDYEALVSEIKTFYNI